MASTNQIYFTIENVKRIQHKETWSFLGCRDPEAASGAAVKEAKAPPFPREFNFRKLSKPGRESEQRPQACLVWAHTGGRN